MRCVALSFSSQSHLAKGMVCLFALPYSASISELDVASGMDIERLSNTGRVTIALLHKIAIRIHLLECVVLARP